MVQVSIEMKYLLYIHIHTVYYVSILLIIYLLNIYSYYLLHIHMLAIYNFQLLYTYNYCCYYYCVCIFIIVTIGISHYSGTCINNTSIMMFKKGSFEIGSTIYPVAIKVLSTLFASFVIFLLIANLFTCDLKSPYFNF